MNDDALEEWPGLCPICARAVWNRSCGPWRRDQLVCAGCGSVANLMGDGEPVSDVR